MRLRFSKMHGLGNDFVVIDGINQRARLSPDRVRRIADRHMGIGCDQLLLVEKPSSSEVDFRYRIFNCDGSEVENCGNGARCFAVFVREVVDDFPILAQPIFVFSIWDSLRHAENDGFLWVVAFHAN